MVVADKVLVELQAKVDQYNRNVNAAERNFSAKMIAIGTSARRAESVASSAFQGMVRAFVSAQAIRGAVQLVDAATRIENGLKVAGLAGDELTAVYDRLFTSAQRNAAPLETLAQLYSRVAIVQRELGTSTEEMLRFTDNVALALRVAGTDAQSASGALLQLSQAMGSGVVRAEEFNSILEGALPIAQAAAAGLEEAGGSVAKLRALVVDGKVSSEAFFRAFEAGAYTLEEKVASAELTVSQQFVRLQNVLIDVAREFNEGTKASSILGAGIANLAEIVQQLGDFVQYAIGPVQTLIGLFEGGTNAARDFANEIARITGLEGAGAAGAKWINDLGVPGLSASSSAYGRVMEQTFTLLGATPQDEALARALAGETPLEPLKVVVEADRPAQVSLSDYGLPTAPGKGGKGGSKQSPAEKYAESLADYQRRIDMMNQETALLSQLSPLANDYGFALEKLRATQELENAARRAGIALGPEQRGQIDQLAEAYAQATVEAAKLAESQSLAVERFEALKDAARSALETIIDGFLEGKDAGDIFADVLKNIGSQLINLGLNSLFGGGSTPGMGLFGSFGGPRAAGGPVQSGRSYLIGEKGPELFTPSASGMITANDRIGGDAVSLTFAPTITVQDGSAESLAKVERVVAKQAAEFEGRVKQIVRSRGHKWR